MSEGIDFKAILEAMIFASAEAVPTARMIEALQAAGVQADKEEILEALSQLLEKWEANKGGIELAAVGGGYIFRTAAQYGPYVRQLLQAKPTKLTPAQLEILAMVAYRQPITRLEIDELRGVDSSAGVRKLLALKLIKMIGKSEGLGKPILYGTTREFLEFFGLNSLHDLPTLREHADLTKDDEGQASQTVEITVDDLYQQGESILSEETERLSEQALEGLEKAMNALQQAPA